jgi:HEAT repeat protein
MSLLARLDAVAVNGRADAAELALLLDALGAPTKAEQRRAAEVLAGLARAGQDVGPLLERGLGDGLPRRRWGTAYACSVMGVMPPACFPILLEALGSDDGDVRWAAATIIRSLPVQPDIVSELRALARAASPLQRKMALYCLRDLSAQASGLDDELLAALRDDTPAVRLAALSAVTALARDRRAAARAVTERLDDESAGVRRAAAAALGRLGPVEPAVIEALRRARDGADPALTRAAASALVLLGGA